jgi:hypothetical protein
MTIYSLSPGLGSIVLQGGVSVQIADENTGITGGYVFNPLDARDQNIHIAEPLYISLVRPATLAISSDNIALMPGETFSVPAGSSVWVNALTAGHSFTGIFISPYNVQYPPTPVPGQPGSGLRFIDGSPPFPPGSVTGLTGVIPSYLYQEYSDDDDLQGFVAAQNTMQQDYVDTFNALNLPIYSGPIVSKALLDWVGQGVYGMLRPLIGTGMPLQIGPLNTWAPNWKPYPTPPVVQPVAINEIDQLTVGDIALTNDDVYRRILTWHFYKGSRKYFSVRWLKRRIWRFLFGVNGTDPQSVPPTTGDWSIADTEQISISFGVNRNVTIRFVLGVRTITGGAMLNMFGPNGFGISTNPTVHQYAHIELNALRSTYVPYEPLPFMAEFKAAMDIGALEMPYQFNYTVHIG